MDTYQVDEPDLERFTTNQKFTSDELPTLVEQSQDLMLMAVSHDNDF